MRFMVVFLSALLFFSSCKKTEGVVEEKDIPMEAKKTGAKLNNGDIELVAFYTEPLKPRHGESFKVVTFWKFNKKFSLDYKLFFHFEDEQGDQRFVIDKPLRNGNLKTVPVGKIIRDDANVKELPAGFDTDKLAIYTGFFKGNKRTTPEKKYNDGENRLKLPVIKTDKPSIVRKTLSVYAIAGKSRKQTKIDGKLDESYWKNASTGGKFWQTKGKNIAREQTTVMAVMDDKYLYVGFDVDDSDIYAELKNTDDPIYDKDDVVEIFIDANGDRKKYYEIQVSAAGVKFDSSFNGRRKNRNDDWDSGIVYAVHLNGTLNNGKDKDKGWSAEIAIPWKAIEDSVNTPPKDGDIWKAFFYRINRHTGKRSTSADFTGWVPNYSNDFHNIRFMGDLKFVYEEIL